MKNKNNILCIFDCETIPDTHALNLAYGYTGNEKEIMQQAFKQQKERTGSEFLPINFHRVIAISAVMANEFGQFERVSSIKANSEDELIFKFISFINSKNPRLISFNGRGFDLPMLMVRAMKYNLSCPTYFDTSGNGMDKWTNYRSRYDGIFHLDLCDHMGEFGNVRGLSLDALCKSLNIPGKYDTHGDDVYRLYIAGEQEKIEEYCESDTLNTYWLFLKYELLRGNITQDDYTKYLNIMAENLIQEKDFRNYTPVFCNAIDDELSRLNLKPNSNKNNEQNIQSSTKIQEEFEEEIVPIPKEQLNQIFSKLGVQKGTSNLKYKK